MVECDKDKRLTISSLDSYERQGQVHIGKDPRTDWETVRKGQDEVANV